MVNKFKTILKKEKGFTLVELLAVIVILGIIVAIAVPAIGNIIEESRTKADEAEIQLIVDAARLYEIQDGNTIPVTVDELETAGYLDERDGDDIPDGTVDYDTDGNLAFTPES